MGEPDPVVDTVGETEPDVDTVGDVVTVSLGEGVAEPEREVVGLGEPEPVVEDVGDGELHTVSDVVVQDKATIPLPGLEPQVEQVRHKVCPGDV